MDKNRVAIYIRVSTNYQIDKDSIPMQRKDLIAYSELMLNTDDYVIFEDAGYSGKNMDRPKFQDMMTQIRAGLFTHLLVWKIDRISRNLLDFATMYRELKDLGVTFVSKNEQFDTSSAMGEAMLKIILVFAELERNMTSERVAATMLSRANGGKWNGGRVPFGYSYDRNTGTFFPDPDEKDLAIAIHDRYEETRSLTRLAQQLNKEGCRSRIGTEWSPVTLHLILTNYFYCGDYTYNKLKEGDRQKPNDESKWVIVRDHHVALVTREQKERICEILSGNSKLMREKMHYDSHSTNIHVFGGLVHCGRCGRLMNSAVCSAKKYPVNTSRYTCPRKRKSGTDCLNPSVTDLVVGEFVFNFILNMLNLQRRYVPGMEERDIQQALLRGGTFSYIDHIDSASIADLVSVLSSGTEQSIYGRGITLKKSVTVDTQTESLKQRKVKIERAIDRLQNLYLFSDESMSETEYIIKRQDLIDTLNEIDAQLGMKSSTSMDSQISDEDFIRAASQFIITSKLKNRTYIYYKKLASSVDHSVLKDFVIEIVDNIIVLDRHVTQIVFRNGLSFKFIVK